MKRGRARTSIRPDALSTWAIARVIARTVARTSQARIVAVQPAPKPASCPDSGCRRPSWEHEAPAGDLMTST